MRIGGRSGRARDAGRPGGRGRPARGVAVATALVAVATVTAACGSSGGGGVATGTEPAVTTVAPPEPAGPNPSISARMVCQPKAQEEIASALGVHPTSVSTPTWVGHLYSCRYTFPDGSFVLSVKELDSAAQTTAYYQGLGTQLGDTGPLNGVGQGAFQTSGGDVVARKDWKVLLVDVSGLPAQFGVPPTPSYDISVTIADEIMGCWSGA